MQQIPLSQLPNQTLNVVLDGQYCTISLYWKQERLFLNLQVGSNIIRQGAVCQNRAGIIASPSSDFSGSLHFYDTDGDRPPHWQGLNTRYILLYLSAGEKLPEILRY